MALNGRKVNLFIVGAAKCGTTSMYNYLSEHNDVFMSSVKEPNFFSEVHSSKKYTYSTPKKNNKYGAKIIKDINVYYSLFEGLNNEKIIGEASPSYLWDKQTASKIYEYNQDSKIIILLKEPIERAYSHFLMNYNGGIEKEKNFVKAVINDYNLNETVFDKSPLYIRLGQYFDQINEYHKYFPSDQILILKSVDFLSNTLSTLTFVASFLKIDSEYFNKIDLKKYNETWLPKNKLFRIFIKLYYKFFLSDYINNKLSNKNKKFLKQTFFKKKNSNNQLTNTERNQLKSFFEESNDNLFRDYGIKF